VDPVTFEVIYSAILSTAREMSEALGRSAYSPIIREMLDYSCAIFDDRAQLVAQAENIPSHLGSMGVALLELLSEIPPANMQPGDVYTMNDPYRGGTHTPDVHVFIPVFLPDGEMVGFCGSIAHHVDMGGTNPGTEGFANASIFEEGLRIPPVALYRAGQPNEALFNVIAANVREPKTTLGDLRAQIAACRTGERRLRELCQKYGASAVRECMAKCMDYAERRVRSALLELPDGEGYAEGYLDDSGTDESPVAIRVRVKVTGSDVLIDFSGTDPQMRGGMNSPYAATRSAAVYAVKCMTDPDTPQNEGCFRPITLVAPPGSVVNPRHPAAVSLRHLTVQRVADTILRAFASIWPHKAVAGSFVGFSSLAVEATSLRTNTTTVLQDDLGGGMGAADGHDGIDGVDIHLSNVGILPVEVCEVQYPVRILRTELIQDSGGAGKFRGGLGIRRDYQFLTDGQVVVAYTEQARPEFAPWGIGGGRPGSPARLYRCRRNGEQVPIRKATYVTEQGEVLITCTGGGGGFGDPRQREWGMVIEDVLDGKVSVSAARDVYGVPDRLIEEALSRVEIGEGR
jgi:N-methylhydantoinase B